MRSKKLKGLLSAILALCMAITCCLPLTAFAQEAEYTAKYTDRASKDTYESVLNDANSALSDAAFNGNTIQEAWKLPLMIHEMVTMLFNDPTTSDYYLKYDKEVFEKLPEFMEKNSITTIVGDKEGQKGTLTLFFEEYPVVVKDTADFTAKLDNFIDGLFCDGSMALFKSLLRPLFLKASNAPSESAPELVEYMSNVDKILDVLGVEKTSYNYTQDGDEIGEVPVRFYECVYYNSTEPAPVRAYAKNIIHAILPDVTGSLMKLVQSVSNDNNNKDLREGLINFLPGLAQALKTPIKVYWFNIDLSSIAPVIEDVYNTVNSLPAKADGGFDFQQTVSYLVDSLVEKAAGFKLHIIHFTSDSEESGGLLYFDDMNFENVKAAATTTDVFQVVFHYLHQNIHANKDALGTIINLVKNMLDIPEDILNIINDFAALGEDDDAIYEIYKLIEHPTFDVYVNGEVVLESQTIGSDVTVTAPKAPENKVFDKWVIVDNGETKAQTDAFNKANSQSPVDLTKETITFKMSDMKVCLEAQYTLAPADYSAYDAIIAKTNEINRNLYTAESLKALDDAVLANQVAKDLKVDSQDVIDNAVEAITKAYDALKVALIDLEPAMAEMTPGMIDFTGHPAMAELQPGMAEMTPGMIDFTGHPAMGELQPGMAEMTPGMIDFTGHPAMGELQPGVAEMTPGMIDYTGHPAMAELQPGMVEMTSGMIDYTGHEAEKIETEESKETNVDIPDTGATYSKSVAAAFGVSALAFGIYEVIRKRNK